MANNTAKFEGLHEALLDHFISLLKKGEVTHQELAEMRKFLLDNNITAMLDKNPKMRSLLDELPVNVAVSQYKGHLNA
jgi:hypothetical protein